MRSHDEVVNKLMERPGVRAEVERIEREESALLDALLKARQDAGRRRLRSPNAWAPKRLPWRRF